MLSLLSPASLYTWRVARTPSGYVRFCPVVCISVFIRVTIYYVAAICKMPVVQYLPPESWDPGQLWPLCQIFAADSVMDKWFPIMQYFTQVWSVKNIDIVPFLHLLALDSCNLSISHTVSGLLQMSYIFPLYWADTNRKFSWEWFDWNMVQ